MMSASGSCRTACARSLYVDLLQDLSVRMSASGSCRTSCARSLYEDLLRNFTSISRHRHARSLQKVALRNQKSQLYLHSARLTRTISAEGFALRNQKNAISPAFRALDMHDLRRGLHFEIKKRTFTCIRRTRHARSRQRVHMVIRNAALATQKCNPSQELSPSTSKHRIHGVDSLRLPRKAQSFE